MATETKTFEIKTHEHSYTEPYVYLRREIQEEQGISQEFRNYTDEAALRSLQNYRETSNTFYPQNHWYAFEGDELVGYSHIWPTYREDGSAAEEALTEIPGVKGDRPEVFEALTNAVFERAKELGIESLRLQIDKRNTTVVKEAEALGYTFKELRQARAQINIEDLEIGQIAHVKVFDFDEDTHLEDLLKAYHQIDISKEFVLRQIQQVQDMGDRLLSWKVSYEGDQLTGQSVAYKNSDDSDFAQISPITRGVDISDDTYKRAIHSILHDHIQILIEVGLEKLNLIIPYSRLNQLHLFKDLNVEFNEINGYVKALSNF